MALELETPGRLVTVSLTRVLLFEISRLSREPQQAGSLQYTDHRNAISSAEIASHYAFTLLVGNSTRLRRGLSGSVDCGFVTYVQPITFDSKVIQVKPATDQAPARDNPGSGHEEPLAAGGFSGDMCPRPGGCPGA